MENNTWRESQLVRTFWVLDWSTIWERVMLVGAILVRMFFLEEISNIESNMGNNSTLVTLISFWNLNLDTQSDLTICTKLMFNQHIWIDLSSKISSTTATIDFLLYFETNRNSAPLVDNPRTKQFEWLINVSIWHWWRLVYFHDQQWQPIVSGTSRIVIIEWTAFRCSKLSQPQSYRTGMNFWQSNRDHRKTLRERERENCRENMRFEIHGKTIEEMIVETICYEFENWNFWEFQNLNTRTRTPSIKMF